MKIPNCLRWKRNCDSCRLQVMLFLTNFRVVIPYNNLYAESHIRLPKTVLSYLPPVKKGQLGFKHV